MRLEVTLLGRFEVRRDGHPVTAWPRAGARRLLKLLALAPRHSLPVDQLASALWPHDCGDRVHQRLHHQVYLLRTALDRDGAGPAAVATTDGVVQLAQDGLWVDVARFEAAAQQALGPAADEASLQAALALYGGPLLPGDIDDTLLQARRQHLERLQAELLHALAEKQAERGAAVEAVHSLQTLLQRLPADEVAHRSLIRLYAGLQRRDDAERQYAACRDALAAELGVPPSAQTHQAYRAAMLEDPPPGPAPAVAGPRGVPPTPLVPLIDRDALVQNIAHRLTQPDLRLLSLVGAGGIGKTQLALRVAHEQQQRYRHGAVFVSLAELAPGVGADGVADRLRRALGLAEPAGIAPLALLVAALRERQLLLVCDNCEHLGEAVGLFTELLLQCPLLTVLATSRRRLNLRAEQVLDVPGLAATERGAMRLFVERATAAAPDFRLQAGNRADVRAIVQQLHGVPLAIELVAARVPLLPPAALRHALAEDPGVAAGGGPDRPERHRSMQASLQWSLRLLQPLERQVLERCALFVAPFDMAALAAVCADLTAHLLPAAQALKDLGLLARPPGDDGAAPRWQLPSGGRDGLAETAPPVTGPVAQRFARWFAALARRLSAAMATGEAGALAAFDADHENFFTALALAQGLDDPALLCELLAGLVDGWVRSGMRHRTDPWMRRGAERAAALPPTPQAAFLLAAAGYWHDFQQFDLTHAMAQQALALGRALGDAPLQAQATVRMASALYHLGRAQEAILPLQALLAALHDEVDAPLRRAALNNLANAHLCAGELARARAAWVACDVQFQGQAVPARVAYVHNLSLVAHYEGRHETARALSLQAEAFEQAGAARPQRLVQIHLRRCWMACCRGDVAMATQALATAREVVARAGLTPWQSVCVAHDGKLALLAGQPERAQALLRRAAEMGCGDSEPWDLLDAQLWRVAALDALTDRRSASPEAARALAQLVVDFDSSWRLEQPRILEAAADGLLRADQAQAAGRAWQQAQALRRDQGLRRFAVEQARARRTLAALNRQLDATWRSVAPAASPTPLAWLAPLLAG